MKIGLNRILGVSFKNITERVGMMEESELLKRAESFVKHCIDMAEKPPKSDKNSGEQAFCLDDIAKEWRFLAWEEPAQDSSNSRNVWVEVKKQAMPKPPAIPAACKSILEDAAGLDDYKTPPTLHAPKLDILGRDKDKKARELWNNEYIRKWEEWAKKCKELEASGKTYEKLRKYLSSKGEEYELTLGFGLLKRQQEPERHIILANVDVDIDTAGKFTVKPHSGGANFRIEPDTLHSLGIKAEKLDPISKKLAATKGNPWKALDDALKSLAELLGVTYKTDTGKSGKAAEALIKAPALILKKRAGAVSGNIAVLNNILKQIKDGKPILEESIFAKLLPPDNEEETQISAKLVKGVGKVAGKTAGKAADKTAKFVKGVGKVASETASKAANEAVNKATKFLGVSGKSSYDADDEKDLPLFPLPYNKDQRDIADEYDNSSVIRVQGPPGTGKSHTIANLMSYLLAKGERILVTAKKPEALDVLVGRKAVTRENIVGKEAEGKEVEKEESLLPKELCRLCISLLGNSAEDLKYLKSNITYIKSLKSENIKTDIGNISKLEEQLKELIEERKECDDALFELRGDEITKEHDPADGYKGTAIEIAKKVNNGQTHKWFTDTVDNKPLPQELQPALDDIFKRLSKLDNEEHSDLKLLPAELLNSPLSSEDFEEWGERADAKQSKASCNSKYVSNLTQKGSDTINEHLDKLLRISKNLRGLKDTAGDSFGAMEKAMNKLDNNIDKLLGGTEKILKDIDKLKLTEKAGNKKLDPGKGSDDVSALRKTVYEIIDGGMLEKSLSVAMLAWNQVAEPFTRNPIMTDEHRTRFIFNPGLVKALYLHFKCEEARELWGTKEFNVNIDASETYTRQKKVLEYLCSVMRCREAIQESCPEIENIKMNEQHVDELILSCLHAYAKVYKSQILKGLIAASQTDKFKGCVKKVRNILKINEDLEKIKEMKLPKTIDCLVNNCKDPAIDWEDRIKRIDKTWEWAKAKCWLDKHVKEANAEIKSKQSERMEKDKELNGVMAELVELKAKVQASLNVDGEACANMGAYLLALKKIGKGTGDEKKVKLNKEYAQKYLKQIQKAIPAFVMPLDIIWENIQQPEPKMFDVVIVDEASRCGFLESIPLLYMTKKIIIVGDDNQIGAKKHFQTATQVSEPLKNFTRQVFVEDTETSLFDAADTFADGKEIRLREHFRCMPEIIGFSNKHVYDGELLPMKPYGQNRLPPLDHEHITKVKGYDEKNDVNITEADAVAERIRKILISKDERYKGKTIGVISLLSSGKQADVIKGLLQGENMSGRRLLCSNADDLQGAERDIICLSLVVTPTSSNKSFTTTEDMQRFNVAASRAREQMILFHSVDLTTYKGKDKNCWRRKLLEYFLESKKSQTGPQIEGFTPEQRDELEQKAKQARKESESRKKAPKPPKPFKSWLEVDVALKLSRYYKVMPNHKRGKNNIDLAIEGENAIVAVECYGDEGKWDEKTQEQYNEKTKWLRNLERCKWKIFRISGAAFYADWEKCLKLLRTELDKKEEASSGRGRRSAR